MGPPLLTQEIVREGDLLICSKHCSLFPPCSSTPGCVANFSSRSSVPGGQDLNIIEVCNSRGALTASSTPYLLRKRILPFVWSLRLNSIPKAFELPL